MANSDKPDLQDNASQISELEKHGGSPEHLPAVEHVHTNIDVIEATTELPYKEINFVGTYIAIALAATAAFAGNVMTSTALQLINAELGPSTNISWIPLAWTLTAAVNFTLVGRLSDVFGRRWFFTSCSAISAVGSIVGCTARGIDQLIGAAVMGGYGSAGQISFNYVLGELVPVRHRFIVNGGIFIATFPFTGFGPVISRVLIIRSAVSWRGLYYVTLALNASSTICWLIWYHPPKFEKLHRDRTRRQEVRDMDYGGIVLFAGGALLFLLGLSWGGQRYPWKSPHVLATLVTGAVTLVVFVFYEIYMPLRRPIIPMHLFRNFKYDVVTIQSTVGGMVYYMLQVIFPQMVAKLFTSEPITVGFVTCAVGGGVVLGQFSGAFLALPGGHLRYKLVFFALGICGFTAAMAGATNSLAKAAALAACAGLFVGWMEITASTIITIVLEDQSEMGTAAGVFASLRAAGGTLATAIALAILTNTANSNVKRDVVPAVMAAGLPLKSIPPFLEALASGNSTLIRLVAGGSDHIADLGMAEYRAAYRGAFGLVFLATIPFGVVALVAAALFTDIDDKMSHDVIRRLDKKAEGPA